MKLGGLVMANVENMVFSGGGIKALLSFCGAVMALEKSTGIPIDQKFHGFAGTSMGAIFSFFLALGGSSSMIQKFICNLELEKMSQCLSVHMFLEKKGFVDGELIRTWLEKYAHLCNVTAGITFEQLWQWKQKKLVIVVTHLNADPAPQSVFISHENYPHLKIIDAVLMSSALPFFSVPRNAPK